jgi:hypothetical protein
MAFRSPACTAPPALAQAVRYTGAALQEGEQLAIPWATSQPVRLLGMALAWRPLSAATSLRLSLTADSGQQPAARVLAEGRVESEALEPDWLQCRWDELVLQTGHYWLGVQVEQGDGIWLGETVSPPGAAWRGIGPAGHAAALPLALLVQPLEPAASGADTAPLELVLNGVPLALTATDPAALTASLEPVPAAVVASSTWTLTARTSHASGVTLKSAELVYRAD